MNTTSVQQLEELPGTATLLARAGLSLIGRPGAQAGLPDRELAITGVRQDIGRYARYTRVCGMTLRNSVAATWLHTLTFGLQLSVLGAKDFPFPAVGLVHVTNTMTLHRPVLLTDELDISVRAEGLRPHKSGVAFDLCARIAVEGELAWQGRSTYLARGARLPQDSDPEGSAATDRHGPTIPIPELENELPPLAYWRVDGRLVRDYAGVSGDYNPIHLNPMLAKAFGFPRTIAHGMWSHARAIAALEPRLPAAYRTSVEFKKPLALPATVAYRASKVGGGWQYAVTSKTGSRTHLLGSAEPL